MNNKIINITILIFIALFISFRLFTACGELKKDGSPLQSDPIEELPAVFTGMIPCADCPGINYYLLIEEDGFRELSWYLDRDPEPFITDGYWVLRGDSLLLYSEENDRLKTFLYEGNRVVLLDQNLKPITGELSDMYVLEKSQEEMSIRQHHEKLREDENIRFLATGNEPFWNIRIDDQNVLHYRTPETEWQARAEITSEDDDSISWTAGGESGSLVLTADQNWCRDSMSGFLFTHSILAEMDDGTELRGCGRFLEREQG